MRIAKWAAVAAIGFSVGCGGSDAPAPVAQNGSGSATAVQSPSGEIPSDPVGRVVYDFLESVRVGQGENAAV